MNFIERAMVKKMVQHMIKHWITSGSGVVLGPAVFHLVQSGCGTTTWQNWAMKVGTGAAVLALGLIAKDPNKQ